MHLSLIEGLESRLEMIDKEIMVSFVIVTDIRSRGVLRPRPSVSRGLYLVAY